MTDAAVVVLLVFCCCQLPEGVNDIEFVLQPNSCVCRAQGDAQQLGELAALFLGQCLLGGQVSSIAQTIELSMVPYF